MNPMFESSDLAADEKAFGDYMQQCQLQMYNGGTQCDVLFEGPCSCGAWHFRKEFISRCNRGNNNLWQRIVADCRANGIPIPHSLSQYDIEGLERDW